MVGRTPFPLEVDELDERYAGVAVAGDGYRVEHLPTRHTVPSLAFALVEDPRPGAFDVAAARELGVEEGPDFGAPAARRGGRDRRTGGPCARPTCSGPRGPAAPSWSRGDTEPCDAVLEAARGAAVLVHEATFLDEDRERARETRHSTAREAAALAREADVGLLVLTHLSSRHAPREVREEAEREFARVLVPRDFDQVEVPFPERGEPIVHPARARRGGGDAPSEAPATVAPIDL